MNRKGIMGILINPIFWVVILIVVALFIVVPRVTASNFMDSDLTPRISGCEPDLLGVSIQGTTVVENSAFWETEPSISRIEVDKVTAGRSLIGFESFKIKVQAINPSTGNQVAVDTSKEAEIDKTDVRVPYSLSFKMPDNNCDGTIDDFDLRLESELISDDPGDVQEDSLNLNFRSGKFR